MDSRVSSRNVPPAYDERIGQESRMMRPVSPFPSPEDILASRADEITREILKLAAAQAEKLSIRTEGDAQIRSLLDHIVKREANVRAGDYRKRELQETPIEAQSMTISGLGTLFIKNEQVAEDLEYSRALAKDLPEIRAKLDLLMKKHQSLCETIKYEIGLKVEHVDQMRTLENVLFGITGKVESLCTEVSNAEEIASALILHGVPNMDLGNLTLPSFHGNCGIYADGFD
ncbi:hypothetical protein ACS0TY_024380 [Phlomoides rotata]